MSAHAAAPGTQLWLDGQGDWRWPGARADAAEQLLPPTWVPALPRRFEPALASGAVVQDRRARRQLAWGVLVSALATLAVALGLGDRRALEGLLGAGASVPAIVTDLPTPPSPPPVQAETLPPLHMLAADAAGSAIAHVAFASGSLGGEGSFYAYLPPGYALATQRYPTLFLLHGRDGHANSFLEIGIQRTLDHLIDAHAIAPMIVVMVQDLPGLDNWRDIGSRHSATYVIEVQELADRMLRTIPARGARAIAGSSMGGFGAMNVALANPLRFAVVESWLGFFNGLEGTLQGDRPVIAHLGLRAFLYGASEDPVAVPSEDPEFAAALRADGAEAEGVIYPGGHSLEKVQEHLETGLLFAARSLVATQRREASEAASAAGGAAPAS